MNTTLSWVAAAAWCVTTVALYTRVPDALSMQNFLFITVVLLCLVVVALVKGRRGVSDHESMSDVIYNMEHPSKDRKA